MTKFAKQILLTGFLIMFACIFYWFLISFLQIMSLQSQNIDYFPQWNFFVFLLNLFANGGC